MASSKGHLDVVKELLQAGASSNSVDGIGLLYEHMLLEVRTQISVCIMIVYSDVHLCVECMQVS